jgi:hypothetical protein
MGLVLDQNPTQLEASSGAQLPDNAAECRHLATIVASDRSDYNIRPFYLRSFGFDRINKIIFGPDDGTTMRQRMAFEAVSYSDTNLIEADLLVMAISCSADDDEDADDGGEDEGRCPVMRRNLVP